MNRLHCNGGTNFEVLVVAFSLGSVICRLVLRNDTMRVLFVVNIPHNGTKMYKSCTVHPFTKVFSLLLI